MAKNKEIEPKKEVEIKEIENKEIENKEVEVKTETPTPSTITLSNEQFEALLGKIGGVANPSAIEGKPPVPTEKRKIKVSLGISDGKGEV